MTHQGRELSLSPLLAAVTPEEAVERGRRSLDRWNDFPWYDPASDGLRAMELPVPRRPFWEDWKWDWKWDWIWLVGTGEWWEIAWRTTAWLLLIGFLVWIGWIIYRSRVAPWIQVNRHVKRRAAEAKPEIRFEALPVAPDEEIVDFLAAARASYAKGDFGRAVVYLFSHQLLELDRRSLIRLDRGKTNRQYLRELGKYPEARGILATTVASFERVFYGGQTLDRLAFETCWTKQSSLAEYFRRWDAMTTGNGD